MRGVQAADEDEDQYLLNYNLNTHQTRETQISDQSQFHISTGFYAYGWN